MMKPVLVVDNQLLARAHTLVEREMAVARERDRIEADLIKEMGLPLTWTYIIRGARLVKIGKAKNVRARLKSMQTGSPEKLNIIRLIPFDCERQLHLRFAPSRRHGEWFAFDVDMLTESYGEWLLNAARSQLAEAA